jgi:hypothetical protein
MFITTPCALCKNVWRSCPRVWSHISLVQGSHDGEDFGHPSVGWAFWPPMLSTGPRLNVSVWATVKGMGYALNIRFQPLLAERDPMALESWLQEAETAGHPSFSAVARSCRQDHDTIQAAQTMPWSTGQCAGQIGRCTRLKRLGYGCAQVHLRRQRILHRRAGPAKSVKQRREVRQPAAA